MATKLRCSLCERDLKAHCLEGRCGWWTCTNIYCQADRYDVVRGVLRHNDGTLEDLAAG